MAKSRAHELIQRYNRLGGNRSTWDNHWDDLCRVMLPRRLGFASVQTDGDKRVDNLYDGTPMQAARGLANAVASFVRPEGGPWFFLKAADDRFSEAGEVKAWLADSEDRLRRALDDPKARFRQATGECDLDLVVLGTGVVFVGDRLTRLSFQSVHLKDAVVIWDEEGNPGGLMRERVYTLRQAAAKFGEANLSEESRKSFSEEKYDEKVTFLHVVLARKEGRADAMLPKNLPYADIWIEVKAEKEVQVRGFHEFPFVVPRWDTSSGEDYGRSPGMIALPDSNTLQAMGETILIAGQRAADPPLAVPSESAFNVLNTFPGGLAYYDAEIAAQIGRIPIAPLENGTNLPITRDMQRDMRDQVMAAFLKNILNLPAPGPKMTATEIMARKEEFVREIGPVFGRLETDYTAPLVERAFRIMLRAPGALAPVPDVLQGRSVRFEYESPVKRMRQQIKAAAMRQWVANMQLLEQAGHPEGMDLVNVEEYARYDHESANLPTKVILSPEQVAQKRQARMEAQQTMAEMAAAQQTAQIADTGASAMQKMTPPQQRAA